MGSSKNRRRQKTGAQKEERGIRVGREFNTPKSTQSGVSWFRALYMSDITGSAVYDMV